MCTGRFNTIAAAQPAAANGAQANYDDLLVDDLSEYNWWNGGEDFPFPCGDVHAVQGPDIAMHGNPLKQDSEEATDCSSTHNLVDAELMEFMRAEQLLKSHNALMQSHVPQHPAGPEDRMGFDKGYESSKSYDAALQAQRLSMQAQQGFANTKTLESAMQAQHLHRQIQQGYPNAKGLEAALQAQRLQAQAQQRLENAKELSAAMQVQSQEQDSVKSAGVQAQSQQGVASQGLAGSQGLGAAIQAQRMNAQTQQMAAIQQMAKAGQIPAHILAAMQASQGVQQQIQGSPASARYMPGNTAANVPQVQQQQASLMPGPMSNMQQQQMQQQQVLMAGAAPQAQLQNLMPGTVPQLQQQGTVAPAAISQIQQQQALLPEQLLALSNAAAIGTPFAGPLVNNLSLMLSMRNLVNSQPNVEADAAVERIKKKRRESARRSRARKNDYVQSLEVENTRLKTEVSRLKKLLSGLDPSLLSEAVVGDSSVATPGAMSSD